MKMDVSKAERDQILMERKISGNSEQNSVRAALYEFRAERKLTQKEFAKAAGVSHATINKFEQGANVTKITLAKIKMCIGIGR